MDKFPVTKVIHRQQVALFLTTFQAAFTRAYRKTREPRLDILVVLLLLQDNGLIKLKDETSLTATVNDIAENPHNLQFVELEAAQVARVVNEVEFVVLNGNYALEAGYSVGKDAIAYEANDSIAAKTYVNIIAVKEGNENSDKIKALVSVLRSDEIKKFIDDTYDGAVIFYEK